MGGQEAGEARAGAAMPVRGGRVRPDEASMTVTRVTGTVPAGGERRGRRRGASASVTTTTSCAASPA